MNSQSLLLIRWSNIYYVVSFLIVIPSSFPIILNPSFNLVVRLMWLQKRHGMYFMSHRVILFSEWSFFLFYLFDLSCLTHHPFFLHPHILCYQLSLWMIFTLVVHSLKCICHMTEGLQSKHPYIFQCMG